MKKEWSKAYFDEKTGGFNVYHKNHQFSEVKADVSCMSRGDTEKYVGMRLARQGKQIEFLAESGIGGKNADLSFDDETWDIKNIAMANQDTIRKYLKNAKKAGNVIFFGENTNKAEFVKNAVEREIGNYRKKGKSIKDLPKVYYFFSSGEFVLLLDTKVGT